MTTTNPEFGRLVCAVNDTLAHHQQHLQLQQQQIEELIAKLNIDREGGTTAYYPNAIDSLNALLDRYQNTSTPVRHLLDTLVQAQDAQNLTIDPQGELAIYLKLELAELANRLGIDLQLLVKATHSVTNWQKLTAAHPDPDGYQWQFPSRFQRRFYHQTDLQIVGTKATKIRLLSQTASRSGSELN